MRLFLALDTPDLGFDLKKLKVNLNKGKNLEHRWVPENQWHIPLLQLGEMGQGGLMHTDQLVTEVLTDINPFDLKLEGVWAYPTQDHGRLLWIGVQNSKSIRELQSLLSEKLEIKEEGAYKPHLPIIRLRNFRELSDLISPLKNTDFGKVQIHKIVLYEMTSGGAFPTFRKIKTYELTGIEDQFQNQPTNT